MYADAQTILCVDVRRSAAYVFHRTANALICRVIGRKTPSLIAQYRPPFTPFQPATYKVIQVNAEPFPRHPLRIPISGIKLNLPDTFRLGHWRQIGISYTPLDRLASSTLILHGFNSWNGFCLILYCSNTYSTAKCLQGACSWTPKRI